MSSPIPPNTPKKEISSELRMVIAFALMGVILFATPWLYRKMGIQTPAEKTAKTTAVADKDKKDESAPAPVTAPVAAPAPAPATTTSAKGAAAPALPTTAATTQQEWVLDTNRYHVIFSNQGAVVKSWTIKDHKDANGKPLELVNQPGAKKAGYPFTLDSRTHQLGELNKAFWVGTPRPDGLSIEYNYANAHFTAKKVFSFDPNSYVMQFASELTRDGSPAVHEVAWRAGFGDMAVINAPTHQQAVQYDTAGGSIRRSLATVAKKGPTPMDGNFTFAGIEDQYFALIFLPPQSVSLKTTLFEDTVPSPGSTADGSFPGVAVGGEGRNQFAVYVGPKEMAVLSSVNPKLTSLIDWGRFGFIAQPLFVMLRFLNNGYVHSYGWSIIILTIFINIALFPLKLANLKSMRKMQMLTPEMNRINDKYKGLSMSDPKAQLKQQEVMDLYKKHGVNPMGGCIPMLIQIPFLMAFYTVLSVTIEMRFASWLWVGDLSQPEHFAIRFLPLIMIGSSVVLQRMTPMAAGGDPSQQKIMQFMPIMMGVLFWPASSGLVLYWLTSNLIGMAQQLFFNKTAGTPSKVPLVITAKPGKKRS